MNEFLGRQRHALKYAVDGLRAIRDDLPLKERYVLDAVGETVQKVIDSIGEEYPDSLNGDERYAKERNKK